MSDGYVRQRTWYGDWSGAIVVAPLTASPQTLVTCRAQNVIRVQSLRLYVSGVLAGATWDVQDSTTGQSLTGAISVAALPVTREWDFGPKGVALTPGANLVLVMSGQGATGEVSWDAYQRLRTDIAVTP